MESTTPDPDNAGVGKSRFISSTSGRFFIKILSFKFINFSLIVLAAFFMPFLTYNGDELNLINMAFLNGFSAKSLIFLVIIAFIIFGYLATFLIQNKYIKLTSFFVNLCSLILLFLTSYFLMIKLDGNTSNFIYNGRFYLLFIFLIFVTIYSTNYLFDKIQFSIEDIVEIGIFVSLSIVLDLSFFKVRIGSSGGSISLALLPLMILALRKGFGKSFFAAGIIFGFINCLTDGYGLFTYPFDYLLGFGSISMIGVFKNLIMNKNNSKKIKYIYLIIGIISALIIRLFAATLSGMIFYNLKFAPSLIYQVPYVIPSMLICGAILCILMPLIIKLNKRFL